ncbi:hypothetical protein BGW37DRAFT_474365 [Umbelopsis sp. PMI_123]|nr:hypothetical protein BGW37DRAFT_474365 [Umbelopsis sp. PMI_123]
MGLHEVGTSEISTNEDKSLDQLRHRIETSHKDFIMSEIDLESQIAAVQVLEKEMGKLNGLPQLLPILRSSIKDYEAAIKKDRQAIARVDNDRLSACIADAAEASLTAVVRAHGMKSASASNNNVEKLDKMTKLLVEQAAVNQLLLYILEIEEELLNERTDHQRAFLLDIEELSHQMDPPPSDIEFISNEDEENFLSNLNRILSLQLSTDDLLDEVMEPQSEDLPAIVQLERLKNEIEGTKDRMEISMERIEQMMLDSQNAIEVIEKFSEVYINDQETDTHIPEETQQLHEQLENFVNDLQNEIQRFQKETTDSGELAEKKRRFSLFWTDQSLFEKEFGSM